MVWKIFFSFPLSFHLYTDTKEEILCNTMIYIAKRAKEKRAGDGSLVSFWQITINVT